MTAPGDAPQLKPLTASVIQDLSARIADAALRPGDRLPTAEGLVVTRRGRGAFLSSSCSASSVPC